MSLRSIAVLSLALAVEAALGAARPRYGGALRVQIREAVETPDPPQPGQPGGGERLADLSGAFRIVRWEPGRRAVYEADENASGGRPFLDSVEVEMARPPREALIGLELGKADVAEIGPGEARRAAAGRKTWLSSPVRLVALVFGPRAQDARVREALALAVDRAAIHTVLLQRQGAATGALLPQWLSGYAFLFPAAQDLSKARGLTAGMPAAARALTLAFDAKDATMKAVAERIALNARDAGLTVSVAPQSANADVRLAEVRIGSPDPARALAETAAALGLQGPAAGASPEALYMAERALLEGFQVVPLFHLPDIYGVNPRVRTWLAPGVTELGRWRMENIWLEPGK